MIKIAVFTFLFALAFCLSIYVNWYDNITKDEKERNEE